MPTAGSLDFVLTANSTQLRQELGKVRQESQATAVAITNLFSGDTINAVGFRVARGTITGLISDIDEMNNGLAFSESLTRNLANSFADLGDIALLQLGQIAQFLGDDLFQTPLAGLQSEALGRVGLGQLEGAFQIITAGSNAAKILETALGGATTGLNALDAALGQVEGNAQAVSGFFKGIAGNAQLASSVLVGTVKVIDAVIEELIDTLASISPAVRIARDAAKELGIEFSIGKSIFGDYINQLNRLDEAAQTAANAADTVADGAESARRGIGSAGKSIESFGDKLASQQKAAKGFENAIRNLADAGQLLDVYNQVNGVLERFTGSLEDNFNAAKGAESLRNRLELVSVSAGGAAEDLGFVGGLATDLGVDLNAASQGYVQFSTAANLANLSVEQTKSTFEGITQATSVMGLSAADTQGVFLALQQSLSSGNVQLEELNQLSERIPGTFQAAAAALGVTTGELKGLISTGKVDSAEFLPKFAEQLKVFTDAGLVDAMNSGEAAVNRFNNALGNFQIAAGQAWLEVGTPALNTFSKAIEFAAKNEEYFSTIVDSVGVTAAGLFVVAMGAATVATIQFVRANKTATIELLGNKLQLTGAQLGQFARNVGIAYVGVLVLYELLKRFKDGGEDVRDSIQSIDRSLLELDKASGKVGETISNALPIEPPPIGWIDSLVAGYNDINEATNRFFGFDEKAGNITTNAEKQLNDFLVAIGDFSTQAQEVLSRSLEFRVNAENGEGPIKEIKEIEAALKQLEQQRLKTDPNDQQAIAALAAQEADLLKRRNDAQKEVLANQSALNNALEQAKRQLQNLDPAKLGTKGYEQAKGQLETQINLLETEKGKFDDLTKSAEVTAESITKNFQDATKALDSSFANTQADIEEAFAAGTISQEQAQEQQLAAEKDYLEDRLQANRDTAQKLRTELENNAKLKAIDPTKATLSTEQEEEYKKQLEQIDLDIAKTRVDLAKNVQSTRQQLNDEEIAKIRENQAEAEAITQRSENTRILAIKKRLQEGQITEEQANKEIEAAQKQSITEQINLEKQKLADIETLKAQGTITAKEAAEQEREVLGNLSDLNLQRIDAELQARKAANDEVIREFEDGIKKADAAINKSQSNRKLALAEDQLGGLSAEDSARQELEIEQQTIAQKLALKQKEIAGIQEQRQRGVRSAKEAAEIEAQLIQEIGDLKLQQVQAEIKAQQDLLGAISARAAEEVQTAETAEAEKIAAIKEQQAARLISEQDAAEQIAAINLGNSQELLQIKRDELAEIQAQRQSGELTIDEAAQKEKAAIAEIAQLRQQAADAEIANRQTQLTALDQQLATEQAASEYQLGLAELAKQSLADQTSLLDAQLGLLEAQNGLSQQRLEFAIQEAEEKGRTGEAERLRNKLLDEQIKAEEQKSKIAIEQFRLKVEQQKIDLATQKTQAEIAKTEAEIALQKAIINGASLKEVENLTRMLDLRGQQLSALDRQAAAQSKINQLEFQALKAKQLQTVEAQKQQQIQARAAVTSSRGSSSSRLVPGEVGGGGGVIAGGSRKQRAVTTKAVTNQLDRLARSGNLNTLLNASTASLGVKTGLTDARSLGFGENNREILNTLKELVAVNKANNNRPNVTVGSVDQVGQVYNDISRNSFRSSNL